MSVYLAARIGFGLLLSTGALLPPTLPTVVAQERSQNRQQIAVVDFSHGAPHSPDSVSGEKVGEDVSARMVAALAAEEAYTVVTPQRVRQASRALNLTHPLGSTDAIRLGQHLNVDVVVTGTITEYQVEQVCVGGDQCSPEIKAQVAIEGSMIEVDSGHVATRRSNVSMKREQSGHPPSSAGRWGTKSLSGRNVLDDAVEKAIANLVKGLMGEPDSIEFRRNTSP